MLAGVAIPQVLDVIAVLPPGVPTDNPEYVMIGAHYDHLGYNDGSLQPKGGDPAEGRAGFSFHCPIILGDLQGRSVDHGWSVTACASW